MTFGVGSTWHAHTDKSSVLYEASGTHYPASSDLSGSMPAVINAPLKFAHASGTSQWCIQETKIKPFVVVGNHQQIEGAVLICLWASDRGIVTLMWRQMVLGNASLI